MIEEKLGTAFEADEKELIREFKTLRKFIPISLIWMGVITALAVWNFVRHLYFTHFFLLSAIMVVFWIILNTAINQRLSYLSLVLYLKSKEIKL